MKKIIVLSSILLCNLAIAYDENTEYQVSQYELDETKYEVLEKAKQYAQSVACMTTFDDDSEENLASVNNVYPINYYKMFDDSKVAGNFLVLWGGDVGCAGGSGTYGYSLTEFQRISDSRPFTMSNSDLLMDLYEVSEINTRFIQDISYNNRTNTLEVVSFEFAPKDSNCCPSLKYRYNFKNSDYGNWKLSEKVRLN
ncbi:hypothetical protein [Psychrobacter fulvigenes]|uniref:hypothetical protein n=1 Tax=Psychrobacter fulvigenes TaxID=533323 RepID=UPI0019193D88|nr:hypothetical protein [Psychrobacter fulvigenes]